MSFSGTFEGLFGGGTSGHTFSTDLTRQKGHQIPGKHLTTFHPGNWCWCLIQELLKVVFLGGTDGPSMCWFHFRFYLFHLWCESKVVSTGHNGRELLLTLWNCVEHANHNSTRTWNKNNKERTLQRFHFLECYKHQEHAHDQSWVTILCRVTTLPSVKVNDVYLNFFGIVIPSNTSWVISW